MVSLGKAEGITFFIMDFLMTDYFDIYLWVAAGVAISILLPILREMLPTPGSGDTEGVGGVIPKLILVAKPYLALMVFSLVVALLVVAFALEQLTDWRVALLAGYASDSTIQKIRGVT